MHTTLYALREEPFVTLYRDLPRSIPLSLWTELAACADESGEVAEELEQLDGGAPPKEGDRAILSPAASGALFRICLAQCQADSPDPALSGRCCADSRACS